MTHQQRRLRREYDTNGEMGVMFSEKTCDNRDIKLEYYGTIQDLYDMEYNIYENED